MSGCNQDCTRPGHYETTHSVQYNGAILGQNNWLLGQYYVIVWDGLRTVDCFEALSDAVHIEVSLFGKPLRVAREKHLK